MTVTSLKVKVVRRPNLKLKVLPRFPGSVTATSPILLSKVGGNYTFSFDPASVVGIQPFPAIAHQWINGIAVDGTPSAAQPAFSDISGTISATQIAALTISTAKIALNAVTNAVAAQMAAFTIKGNATGALANQADISIPALTQKATPVAADIVMISDSAASNALKFSTASDIAKTFAYTQVETGAVSSPLIRRLNNTLFASEFGAVGDDSTNDATALQSFLTALALSGKEGRFDPGKSYFVSGADLLLAPALGVKNTALYGEGSQIRTNPAQARIGLKIQKVVTSQTRPDETRKVLVDGLRVSQFQDANAVWGIQVVGSTFVTLRDCTVICGSDNATSPSANYAAYYFAPSDVDNPDTGSFWCSVNTCAVKGATTPTPVGLRIDGQCNAMHVTNSTFSNGTKLILIARASLLLNANSASLANGVRITNCDFEGVGDAISVVATPSWSTLPGLIVSGCRAESLTNFMNFNNLDLNPTADRGYPSFRQNYVSSSVTNYITNPNLMIVDSDGPWTSFTPTITSTAGTLTTVSTVAAYRLLGKQVNFIATITLTAIGTGSGRLNMTLPFGTTTRAFVAHAIETQATGKTGSYVVASGATTGVIQAYDNATTFVTNGNIITVTGTYEIA